MVGLEEAIITAITDFLGKPTWKFSTSPLFDVHLYSQDVHEFFGKKKCGSGGQRDRERCGKRSFAH
jgi:hypothetical protein